MNRSLLRLFARVASLNVLSLTVACAVNLNATSSYIENFDSMGTAGTTPPAGWSVIGAWGGSSSTWTNATGILASTMASNAGTASTTLAAATAYTATSNTSGYNYALSTSTSDRALGVSPTSGTGLALQLTLTNVTGSPLNKIYTGYQIRRFANGSAENELPGFWLFYSVDNGVSWINASALNPTTATVPNTTGVTTVPLTAITLSGPVAHNGTLLLRWVDDNASQSSPDQIVGLDNVTVQANQPPAVSLTSPASGASSTTTTAYTLSATAADDGAVNQVEFLRDGVVVGADATPPYAFTDATLPAGIYHYSARATDNQGAITTTAAVPVSVVTQASSTALYFDGVNDYVTMGAAPQLAAGGPPSNGFTLECWFRKEGAGVTSGSGTGGVTAVPLFGKGRSENDGSNVDCDYFFGITTGGLLVADFEAYPASGITPGQNYPVTASNTPIVNNTWYHAAVTYDGPTATWKVYLNGAQVGTAAAAANASPRYDSIQHFGIGAAFDSNGIAAGAFAGRIDEVRVWNHTRTAAEIFADKNYEITAAPGLIGRYGLNEGAGTAASNTPGLSGAPAGTLTNFPLWVDGPTFAANVPPVVNLTSPAANSEIVLPATITLAADASDSDSSLVKVEFYQGAVKLGEDTTAPYEFQWTLPNDTAAYALTAVATDTRGAVTSSTAVSITATEPSNAAPTVTLTAPLDDAQSLAGESLILQASASDPDGNLAKVEFYQGAVKLGEDTSEPFQLTWHGPAGEHAITAKAIDIFGLSATSNTANVTLTVNQAPAISLASPSANQTGVGTTVTLETGVADPEGRPQTVTFYGRKRAPLTPGPDFVIGTLPDTQFYSGSANGGSNATFIGQNQWYAANRDTLNIAFISHMGDMVNSGDNGTINTEWTNADKAMKVIENQPANLRAYGIPWGGAPGNHDHTTVGAINSPNLKWNTYFGASRWAGKPYFGGSYSPTDNSNNYQLFSASGLDFIIIHLDYTNAANATYLNYIQWADDLLKAHPHRRGIVTSHWLLNGPPTSPVGAMAPFGGPGQAIYDGLKDNPNLFMMLCGHNHYEGRRVDVYQGRSVYTCLQDYQARSNGGDGWLRYYVFSPANNTIRAKTFSPKLGIYETNGDDTISPADVQLNEASEFTLAYDMQGSVSDWIPLGTVELPAGATPATLEWTGLEKSSTYEWYASTSDGVTSTDSGVRAFATVATSAPTVSLTSPTNHAVLGNSTAIHLTADASDSDGTVAKVAFYQGDTLLGTDTTAPFEYPWNAPGGNAVITAVATDDEGNHSLSNVVNLTVMAGTIAYWRFEGEGASSPTDGAFLQDTNGRSAVQAAGIPAPDLSGNGNRLYTWNDDATGHVHRPVTPGTPFSVVPRTGQPNAWHIANAGAFPASFSWSNQSLPGGTNLDTWTSATWTIEASCYTTSLGGFRTVIGREGNDVRTSDAAYAPLYFQKRDDDRFRIAYVDAAGIQHDAEDPAPMVVNTWYHFAAVNDGMTLKLYKKTGTYGPITLVAETHLIGTSANTALIDPGLDQHGNPWGWTIGRGRYGTSDNPNSDHTDRWWGGIDEVRISDRALAPADFLVSFPPDNSDGDGLPNAWEIAHNLDPDDNGLDPNNHGVTGDPDHGSAGDPDADGFTNVQEYNDGVKSSNPRDPSSIPGDIDGDSLPDAWEENSFSGNLAQGPANDPDGDNWNNASEFAAGTDPNNPNSLLKISSVIRDGNDQLVTFATVQGRHYVVQCSNDLSPGSWQPVVTNGNPVTGITGTGAPIQLTDTQGALQPRRFYRIVVTPEDGN